MSFSEQTDFSEEYKNQRMLYDTLSLERSRAGSVGGYVGKLVADYEQEPEGRVAMLQLQRVARICTNPENKKSVPVGLANAFYWGEIVGYRMRDAMSEGEFSMNAYENINQALLAQYDTPDSPQLSPLSMQESVALTLDSIAEMGDEVFPWWQELLARTSSEGLFTTFSEHWQFMLGVRFMTALDTKAAPAMRANYRMDDNVRSPWGGSGRVMQLEDAHLSADERANLEEDFSKVMDEETLVEVRKSYDNSLDEERGLILDRFDYHVSVSEISIRDSESLGAAALDLTEKLWFDFERLEYLREGETICVENDAVVILQDASTGVETVRLLAKDEVLIGSVGGVAVEQIPSTQNIADMRAMTEREEGEAPQGTECPLGVTLCLVDITVVTADNKRVALDAHIIGRLLIGSPKLRISQYLL